MWDNLKASIASVVRTNNNQEITGANLQSVLNTIVNSIGANATFAGIAVPSTNPGTPDGSIFYIAREPGVYSNFNLTIVDGLYVLENKTGSWVGTRILGADATVDDVLLKNIIFHEKLENVYIGANGVTHTNAGFDVYVYKIVKTACAVNISARLGASGYCVETDNNGTVLYAFKGSSSNNYVINSVTSLVNGAYYLKISVDKSSTFSVTDNVGGLKSELYVEGEVVGKIGVIFPTLYGYIQTQGGWGEAAKHVIIPLKDSIKSILIKTNTSNGELYSFFSNYTFPTSVTTPTVTFAEGYTGVREISANKCECIQKPRNAKYLYLHYTSARIPLSVYLDNEMNTTGRGTWVTPSSVNANHYIDKDGVIQSNSNSSIITYDVSNISTVYIRARIGAVASCEICDSGNGVLCRFLAQNDISGINTDGYLNIPNNAASLKISIANNYGIVLFDSSAIGAKGNGFSGKKVAFIGDSITYGYGLSDLSKRYATQFSKMALCEEINLGVSGTCFASNTLNGLTDSRFITRATSANIGNADVVFVFGGTNDFSYDSKPIGELFKIEAISSTSYVGSSKRVAPEDTDAFAGAVHELILQIRNIAPNARVIFVTPINRGLYSSTNKTLPRSYHANLHGNYFQEFCEALKIICNFYAIPVVDMTTLLGQDFQFDNGRTGVLSSMDADGIHPNVKGHRQLAEALFRYCTSNINI